MAPIPVTSTIAATVLASCSLWAYKDEAIPLIENQVWQSRSKFALHHNAEHWTLSGAVGDLPPYVNSSDAAAHSWIWYFVVADVILAAFLGAAIAFRRRMFKQPHNVTTLSEAASGLKSPCGSPSLDVGTLLEAAANAEAHAGMPDRMALPASPNGEPSLNIRSWQTFNTLVEAGKYPTFDDEPMLDIDQGGLATEFETSPGTPEKYSGSRGAASRIMPRGVQEWYAKHRSFFESSSKCSTPEAKKKLSQSASKVIGEKCNVTSAASPMSAPPNAKSSKNPKGYDEWLNKHQSPLCKPSRLDEAFAASAQTGNRTMLGAPTPTRNTGSPTKKPRSTPNYL